MKTKDRESATRTHVEEANAPESHRTRGVEPEVKRSVVKDPRLGPRRDDVTHWRCRRFEDEDDRKGKTLYWGESDDGIELPEWPIKTCSPETISERWGPGRYVVDYFCLDKDKRRSRGPSRVLHITARGSRQRAAAAAAEPPVQTPAKSEAPSGPGDLNLSSLFSLLAYLEDRNDKARVAAAADAKVAQERYRADLEFQLERERLASKERIAQLEAQARTVPVRGAHFDPEALAQRIGEVVGTKVQEALDEQYEDEPPALAAPVAGPQDNTAAIVAALRETLAPVLSLVVAKLANGATVPETALPPIAGAKGNSDPDGEPN